MHERSHERELLAMIDGLTARLEQRFVRHSSYAPDAVQHALVRFSLQDPKPEHPEAWLTRVATNAMIDHIRASERSLVETVVDDLPEVPVGPPTLAQTTTRTLNAELVHSVLAELPERDRRLLQAMYMEGASARDLAREHGLKESGMGRIMDRARIRFRQRFREALSQYRERRHGG